jgi:hypothetical protein
MVITIKGKHKEITEFAKFLKMFYDTEKICKHKQKYNKQYFKACKSPATISELLNMLDEMEV